MEEPNKSEEELEKKEEVVETETETSEETETPAGEGEETEKVETEVTEEETVKLSEYTRSRELLWRMAKDIAEDPDKLAEIAVEDPKRLERLSKEFPKLFKDVKVPDKNLSQDDINRAIEEAVAKAVQGNGKSDALKGLQSELKMTDMEFLDIRDEISEKAGRFMDIEMAGSWKEAVLMAFKNMNPSKYKELVSKEVLKEADDREKKSKATSAGSKGGQKFTDVVLNNYKRLGFSSPEEMVKYTGDKPLDITDHMKG